jgi:small-conductance mechanosensitive channel
VTITVFAIAIVVVLSNLGVNVTGLVAGLGVGGIAIGLAAQGIFADLFAALAILFDRPFRVGDSISYDKGAGSRTVEAIGLKSTRIRGGGGEERILANKRLLDFEILNRVRLRLLRPEVMGWDFGRRFLLAGSVMRCWLVPNPSCQLAAVAAHPSSLLRVRSACAPRIELI